MLVTYSLEPTYDNLELCASRQKPPSASVCWLRQHASSQLAPPRATRSASVAWALCAPGEPDLRLALRARRSAHGAARRGHCAPVCRAAPGGAAAGCHRRLALRARCRWRGRCARPGACGSPVAASRCALGTKGSRPVLIVLRRQLNLDALLEDIEAIDGEAALRLDRELDVHLRPVSANRAHNAGGVSCILANWIVVDELEATAGPGRVRAAA